MTDRLRLNPIASSTCFKIFATSSKVRDLKLDDSGDVNWTQKLLNNAKERLVISGCGSERVCELSGKAGSGPGRRTAC